MTDNRDSQRIAELERVVHAQMQRISGVEQALHEQMQLTAEERGRTQAERERAHAERERAEAALRRVADLERQRYVETLTCTCILDHLSVERSFSQWMP